MTSESLPEKLIDTSDCFITGLLRELGVKLEFERVKT